MEGVEVMKPITCLKGHKLGIETWGYECPICAQEAKAMDNFFEWLDKLEKNLGEAIQRKGGDNTEEVNTVKK